MSSTSLIIHIGAPKTGSSSLQYFFNENRLPLLKNNICHPQAGCNQYGNHQYFANAIHNLNNEQLLTDIRDEFIKSGTSTLLLSSELLYHLDPSDIKTGSNYFHNDAKIIVNIRRQDALALSLYSQYIKQPSTRFKGSFDEFLLTDYCTQSLSQLAKIQQLQKTFGENNVSIRCYSEHWQENEIYADILDALCIDFDTVEWTMPDRKNVHPSTAITRILQLCNQWDLSPQEHIAIYNVLGNYFINHKDEDAALASPSVLSTLQQSFMAENHKLSTIIDHSASQYFDTFFEEPQYPDFNYDDAFSHYSEQLIKTVISSRFHLNSDTNLENELYQELSKVA